MPAPNDKLASAVREINDVLADEVNKASTLQLPLLREYLKDVRNVRMAFAEEVREVLRSTRQLQDITKGTADVVALGAALTTLRSILTPEFVAMLQRLSPPKEEDA